MTTVNDNNRGFVEGTVVRMADGKLKPIERIVPGDWVMSFDTRSARSELEPREVIDVFKYVGRDVLEVRSSDDSLMVMPGQLFLTPGMDWSFAQDSAYITDEQGNARSFEIIKNKQGKQRIYDIIVDDNHSLIANGFRVHNDDGTSVRGGDTPGFGTGGSGGAIGGGGGYGGSPGGSLSGGGTEGGAVRGGDTPGFGTGGGGSVGGGGGYGSGPSFGGGDSGAHGSFGFAGPDGGGNGGGGGGGGDHGTHRPAPWRRGSPGVPAHRPPGLPAPDVGR